MTLPIDEMLTDLRAALDTFEAKPDYDTFDAIQKETRRIEIACEDELIEDD